MFAERLKRARKGAGLSMRDLAERTGVSANAINKYEHGQTLPSSSVLLKLARSLDVRTEYFFRPARVTLERVEYRKRASLPKKQLDRVTHDVLEQVERWLELLDLYPDSVQPVPDFAVPAGLPKAIHQESDVDAMAAALRKAWGLGDAPIASLVEVLEDNGLIVVMTAVDVTGQFDGLACSVAGRPVIVVSSKQPGDRQRLTLAHELAHMLLHGRMPESMDEEKACHRFAGALLLPCAALARELGEKRQALDVRELYMLKCEYGISMGAILMRCLQCGIIDASLQQKAFRVFSREGWRKQEPGQPYPPESTTRLRQLVLRAWSEEFIGEAKAAELLDTSVARFNAERNLESVSDAAAHQ